MSKVRIALISVIAVIFGFIFINTFISVERIDAGCVGIRVNLVGDNRGVDDIEEVTGWVVYMPIFTAIYEFPVYTQVKDYDPFKVNAKDGSEFTVDPTFSYYVDQNKVTSIFRQYRRNLDEIEDGYLRNVVFNCYRDITNTYLSDSLISNRPQFEGQVQAAITKELQKDGFIPQQLTSNLEAPQSLKDAIDAKNRTTQEARQAENRLRKAKAEAEQKVIEAEAEKKVNDLKAAALNDKIIQQLFIEKWDGKLPVYGETPKLFRDITK